MRTTLLRFLLLAAVLAAAVLAGLRLGERVAPDGPPAPPPFQKVTLRPTDPDGRPVPGAWITISRILADRPRRAGGGPADAGGVARFDLPPGAYLFRSEAEGLASDPLRVVVARADLEAALPMLRTLTLAGRVSPARGATIVVTGAAPPIRLAPDPDGAFEVPGLAWSPGRRWLVDARPPDGFRRPAGERRIVDPGPDAVRRGRVEVAPIRLLPAGRITGRLTGPGADTAAIRATDHRTRDPLVALPGESWLEMAHPDPDGTFVLADVPPGEVEAYLVLPRGHRDLGRLRVGAGKTLDLGDIEVPASFPGVVAGRVLFPRGGFPLGGVRLLSDRGFRELERGGAFRIEGIGGDEVTLEVGARADGGWILSRERVAVGRTDLVLRPRPAGRLRIEPLDARDGAPIENASFGVVVGDPPLPGSGFGYFGKALWTPAFPPGDHPVILRVEGYEDLRLPSVTFRSDRENRMKVRLSPLP